MHNVYDDSSFGHGSMIGHNSLGLLDLQSPENGNSHMPPPSMGLDYASLQHQQLRRGSSISSFSDASGTSGEVGSSYSAGGHPGSRSSTPSASPLGLSHSLSSISGLAIATPGSPEHMNPHHVSAPFVGGQHDALLALTHGQDDPEAFQASKRRAQPASLYTNEPMGQDSEDSATPMPASTRTFGGQSASNLTLGAPASVPLTPMSAPRHSHHQSIGSAGSSAHTPDQSWSATTTPDYSVRSGMSSHLYDSPMYGSVPPRMQRMDSFDSYTSGQSSPGLEHRSDSFSRSLDRSDDKSGRGQLFYMMGDKEASHPGDVFSTTSLYHSDSHSLNSSSQNDFGGSAMSRVASAPVPPMSRSMSSGDGSNMSMPSTPASALAPMSSQHDSVPSTPNGRLTSPCYDPYFSAPMAMSRSVGPLASPAAISPLSLLDGGRTLPGAALRSTTPRTRARNTGPPPLIVSSADKLHVCHCGKRFKRMEHLKRHNRTHTQERPHRCPVESCGKWFGRTDNLAQHLKTHFRPAGLIGRSSELLTLTGSDDKGKPQEPRHDPHAAATSAAAVAAQAAASGKRRSTVSSGPLGGPISLTKTTQRVALSPAGSASANVSPINAGMVPLSAPGHQHSMSAWN